MSATASETVQSGDHRRRGGRIVHRLASGRQSRAELPNHGVRGDGPPRGEARDWASFLAWDRMRRELRKSTTTRLLALTRCTISSSRSSVCRSSISRAAPACSTARSFLKLTISRSPLEKRTRDEALAFRKRCADLLSPEAVLLLDRRGGQRSSVGPDFGRSPA